MVAYLLYALFALGGAGVYLALPKPQPAAGARVAGLLLGAGAIVGGLMLLGSRVMPPSATNVYFYIFAAIALLAAGRVVTHPKPVYSAVYFVAVVVAVAALVVLLGAEFLAIAIIIIYAGAILVTYVFVIMLAQQSGAPAYDTRAREPFAGVLVGFVAMAAIAGRIADAQAFGPDRQPELRAAAAAPGAAGERADPATETPAPQEAQEGNTVQVGRALFGQYVVAIQLAGVLLLVGLIGALALVRKRIPRDVPAEAPIRIGEIGRQVRPF